MARKKLLIAAVIVGLFAALSVYFYVQEQQEEVQQYVGEEFTEEVIVAAVDIPAGESLKEEHVTTEDVPEEFLPANPLMAQDVDIYLGQPVAEDIDAGAMVLTSDFAVAEEQMTTLSTRVPPGERAMTIPVDTISGVAGLLQPGDRVDIMGTFPIHEEDEMVPETGISQGYVTMSLLQNVTLLAVGQSITAGGEDDGHASSYSNVTVSLTPAEAELMLIAQTRGELDLLLRNREDMEHVPVNQRTLRDVLEELDVINERRIERDPTPPPCPPGQQRNDAGECVDEMQDIEIIR